MIENLSYPKISIITPSYNQAQFLEQTIVSVLEQNYPNLEYIIIDGGSTDGSVDIIKKYEDRITYWVSEPDKGMYHALQKGFERTTGQIMGWLNSDDMLHRNSLFTLAEIFSLEGVKWVQGMQTVYDERGRTVLVSPLKLWSKYRFWLSDDYQWIQQESTYWHRDLWEKSGSHISQDYKYAGDMELWNRFFKYEKLYSMNALIGGFRKRTAGQLSRDFAQDYVIEAETILKENVFNISEQQILSEIKLNKNKLLKLNRWRALNLLSKILGLNQKIGKRLEELYDYPHRIVYDYENAKQTFLKCK
jgi:glycosyltransferase involved in cell wall biosynthesis